MMMMMMMLTAAVVLLFAVAAQATTDDLFLTIAYCVSDFQSMARIVKINTTNGDWAIQTSWRLPSTILGCAAIYDPVPSLDTSRGILFQDWTSYADDLFSLNFTDGSVVTRTRAKDVFFYGFTSFVIDHTQDLAVGLTGTVENNGYCNSGCFALGTLDIFTGVYRQLSTIPYRAAMSVSAFYDQAKNSYDYYAQVSYPLTSEAFCSARDSDQCLVRIDGRTGEIVHTVPVDVSPYRYGHRIHPDGHVRVFGSHSGGRYGFSDLHMTTGETTSEIAYIAPTIEYKAALSSFSSDEALLAHASGNQYKPDPQLLILDADTGATVVETELEGLAEELRAEYDWIFVWSVDFVARE